MLAYLVIREGSKWTDVFRLVPGQAVTIGRAPTNQIVDQGRALQPLPRRDLSFRRAMDAARPRQPQRHGRGAAIASAATTCSSRATSFASASRNCASSTICPRPFPKAAAGRDAAGRAGRRDVQRAAGDRRLERAVDARAGHDHAPPRPDEISRAARSRRNGAAEGGPGGGQLLPAGLRAGPGARRDRDGRPGPGRPVRGHAGRRRRAAGVAAQLRGRAERRPTWRWSPPAPIRRCRTIAFRRFWPRPCCARARRCWPAT